MKSEGRARRVPVSKMDPEAKPTADSGRVLL